MQALRQEVQVLRGQVAAAEEEARRAYRNMTLLWSTAKKEVREKEEQLSKAVRE